MNFTGTVAYDGEGAGAKVIRLELIDELVLLDWINSPEGSEGLVTRFLGVAEQQEDKTYKTPWVYLSDESGGDLANGGGARITFVFEERNSGDVKISGEWIDFDEREFPFNGRLLRSNSP